MNRPMEPRDKIADALDRNFTSPNVSDSNFEEANIVDVIDKMACYLGSIANAIMPRGVAGGKDETGGHVESLTEAVMGVTGGLIAIANAIERLADAVEYHGK